jgi:ribosomal protein S12
MASHKGGTCASFVVLQDQKKGVKKKTSTVTLQLPFSVIRGVVTIKYTNQQKLELVISIK